ncbi:cytochrome c [Paraburkholderia sp. SARCC-3016]|jgi:cytochrome c|uniref:c-type cytochrome n=1 Tax=Paraburkholderia sp. SARCC-3016 TaxID=3058611 RepID=UPI0028094E71|nr:cytochrome c [Paraburkholderia sp. SARCC-3016]MDQ7976782.1 cytochrome c [Paraburkholderia sp. SARCC-3016]
MLKTLVAVATIFACGAAYADGANASGSVSADSDRYGIGKPIDNAAIARWNIDVSPDGRGLPAGSGTVAAGAKVFAAKCAMCHGKAGEGGIGDPLVGGAGTLTSAKPRKTVGSYWPYATTLFDYIRRAMPYNAPESLSADEVYSVSAWLLYKNGIVPEHTTLDARSLPRVKMPNRDGFIPDPRPGAL